MKKKALTILVLTYVLLGLGPATDNAQGHECDRPRNWGDKILSWRDQQKKKKKKKKHQRREFLPHGKRDRDSPWFSR